MNPLRRSERLGIGAMLLLGAINLTACRSGGKNEIEVEVRSVGYDDASHTPVVVLQDQDHKVALPIWIGPAEAQSIAMQLQGINPPRPMTHDLIKTTLDQTDIDFQKVVINDLHDSTYYAHICLHAGRKDVQIDSRPSDAIALAIRFHRPIFVARALMQGESAIDLQRVAPGESTAKVSGVTVQNLTAELSEYFNLPPGRGVLVSSVDADAPKGLQRGDVILEIEGAVVTGVGDFNHKMGAAHHGMPTHLSVQRGSARLPVEFIARAD
jgi:uncharacterized protein